MAITNERYGLTTWSFIPSPHITSPWLIDIIEMRHASMTQKKQIPFTMEKDT